MVYRVEPLFPFDLAEAMFLVPALESNIVSISALITWRAQQLQKQVEDIDNT